MLRHAEEKDRAALMDYLRREPEFNLFIIGDILAYGMASEEMELFIEARVGKIEAVMMRFRNNFIPCSYDARADWSAIAGRINSCLATPGVKFVSGKRETVERVMPLIQHKPTREFKQHFSVCREPQAGVSLDALPLVTLATPADAGDLADLWNTTFGPQPREHLAEDIERGDRITLVRDAATKKLVAAAAAVAESDTSAMIVGVATHPEHRRKGYASACVWRLLDDLRSRGKSACLFFHNPDAGTLYHRLGFEDIGFWTMLRFER